MSGYVKEKTYVTSQLLPELEDVYGEIRDIFASKWLTNMEKNTKSLKTN